MNPTTDQAFSLEGRVGVLTGAASGIGRQTAIRFAMAGADVVIADQDEAGLEETAEQVRAIGGTASVVLCNVADKVEVGNLAEFAVANHGGIDIWANIAGIIRYNLVVDTPEEELDAILDVNLKGTFHGCAAAAKAMIAGGRKGSIINVASAGMDIASPTISVYAMSKAGVAMLARVLAVELGEHGIRVNTVAPGWVPTGMTEQYWVSEDGSIDEEARTAIMEQRASQSVLGIVGTPDDQALALLYLASDASKFMTGQVLRPNGGMAMPH